MIFPDHSDEIRTILDAAPFPLIISRISDGRVLYANDPLAALVGLTATELIGQETPDFYADPADRKALLSEIKRVGRITNYELRLRDIDGQEQWALASVVATNLRGEAVLIGGLNEITIRKKAERALAESEQRFRNMVENANDIIYMLSPDSIMTYISPNWTDILGHDVSEVLGTSFMPLIHPEDLQRCLNFFNTVLETGERQSGIEYRVKHKDGSWRWHTSNASCLKDNRGKVEAFIGIARDITDKKRTQLALEKALRELQETQIQLVQSEKMAAIGNLVAGVAHEINSPVGAISSMQNTLSLAVSKLQESLGATEPEILTGNSSIRVALEAILKANRVIGLGAERISEIVKSLRVFARLDEAEKKKADVHECLESTLMLIQHELKERIEVMRNYAELAPIVCYPGELSQVFLNILVNAFQAIEGKGQIEITTFEKDNELHISIRDSGRGINKNILKSIFDPGITTKGVGVGTGLGLSICYKIIQKHQGRIEVQSQVDEGSVFTVILPRIPADDRKT